MENKAYMVPNPVTPCRAVHIDSELCTGCKRCIEVCRADVMLPNPEKGGPPVVLYPEECWFCGCCVAHCPVQGAIRVEFALNQRIGWKRRGSEELYRIGMKNPPPPNHRSPVR